MAVHNLAERLFRVVDDKPITSPVLINLTAFKKMYEADKTEDKRIFTKRLMYVWYVADPNSPFFNSENKKEEASLEVFKLKKPTRGIKLIDSCIKEYIKRQSTPAIRAYDRAMEISDSIGVELEKKMSSTRQLQSLMDDIDDACETLKAGGVAELETRLELLERKVGLEIQVVKKQKEMADLMNRMASQVENLIKLRKDVDADRKQIDNDEVNKVSIGKFIIDDLIEEHNV